MVFSPTKLMQDLNYCDTGHVGKRISTVNMIPPKNSIENLSNSF